MTSCKNFWGIQPLGSQRMPMPVRKTIAAKAKEAGFKTATEYGFLSRGAAEAKANAKANAIGVPFEVFEHAYI